ncbi:MAG TPA: alpha/beta fold hydrolase [Longimicrobiales bacterium]|nr:alpha/beta fold hydrolase [Longimicrobiales bacterium]
MTRPQPRNPRIHGAVELADPRPATAARMALEAAMARLLDVGEARVRSGFVTTGNGVIHHLEAGRGEPVVLLHGAGGGAANWFRLIGPLAARWRVLAPDLPGFGLSDPVPITTPLGWTGARYILDWLRTVCDEPVAVIGTSFGGLLALRLAQLAPERVARVVVIDSVGLGRELPWPVRLATIPGIGRLALRPSRSGARALLRTLLVTDPARLRDHEDALVEYLWRSAAAGSLTDMVTAVRLFGGLAGQREIIADPELSDIAQPVLVAWGERDRFIPLRHALHAAATIPRGRLGIIRGAGHSPNWEAPDELLATMEPFLTSPVAEL